MRTSTDNLIGEAIERLAPSLRKTRHEYFFNAHKRRYRFVLRLLGSPPAPGAALLDAGASPGHVSALCQGLGWRAVAADRFPREPFPSNTGDPHFNLFSVLGIPTVALDIADGHLPFRDASFDAVLFNETLEHLIGSPLPAFMEFARVLKPGGALVVTTPNVASLRNRISFLFGRNIYTRLEVAINVRLYKCHNREYTLNEVKELAERAGFRVERAGRANIGEPAASPLRAALRSAYYSLTWLWPPGRSLLYLIARKP